MLRGLSRILLSTDAVGGVWRYALELAAGLAARDVMVVLAVLGPAPDPEQAAEARSIPGLGLRVTGLPLDWTAASPAELDRAAAGLAALARETAVDSVHLHAPALAASVRWPVPVVAVAHSCVGTWWQQVRGGELPPDLAWRAEATGRGLRAADAVIAPSRAFADQLRAVYGPTRPIRVVHNGRRARRLPVVTRTRSVLTAGRLWDEGKNAAALDAAAARLDVPVLAAGGLRGPNGARVHLAHMQTLGPLGEDDLARACAAAAAFASVARYEPFGLAVLEAAQAGLPLLLSDIPTFRELWDGAAVFVGPDAPDAIAAGLRGLLAMPEAWGARAQAQARQYTAERMVTATWNVHAALPAAQAAAS